MPAGGELKQLDKVVGREMPLNVYMVVAPGRVKGSTFAIRISDTSRAACADCGQGWQTVDLETPSLVVGYAKLQPVHFVGGHGFDRLSKLTQGLKVPGDVDKECPVFKIGVIRHSDRWQPADASLIHFQILP